MKFLSPTIAALLLFGTILTPWVLSAPLKIPLHKSIVKNSLVDAAGFENLAAEFTSVPLSAQASLYQHYYTSNVAVGSSKEEFSVVFDTFSQKIFLLGRQFSNNGQVETFICTSSSTCVDQNFTTTQDFYAGTVGGEVVSDNIWVQGLEAKNQLFVLANQDSGMVITTDMLGYMGIGNPLNQTDLALINNLKDSGSITTRTFGIYSSAGEFNITESDFFEGSSDLYQYENQGLLIIDGYDSDYMTEELTMWPTVDYVYWGIPLNNFSFGDLELSVPKLDLSVYTWNNTLSPDRALINVNFNSLMIDGIYEQNVLDYLANNLSLGCEMNNFLFCLCSGPEDIPDITYTFQGTQITIPSAKFVSQYNGFCQIQIQFGVAPFSWQLGTPFLDQYYAYFDADNQQIGLATSTNAHVPPSVQLIS